MITFRLPQKIIDNASYERQKQHAIDNLYNINIRHFPCCRRSRESRGLVIWNLLLACQLRRPNRRANKAMASYEVVSSGVSRASNTMTSLLAATKQFPATTHNVIDYNSRPMSDQTSCRAILLPMIKLLFRLRLAGH